MKRATAAAAAISICFGLSHAVAPARADAVADFYKGQTIRIINWASAGGEYDLHGRVVSRHIGRHIPGNPTVVQTTMTGGGGLVAANHLYNVAPRDGTSLAVLVSSLALLQAIGREGVKYDAGRFNWIGTITPTQENLVAWHTAPVKRFEDLLTTEFVLGASGAGSTSVISPTLMNALLGTRIKIVPGYPGGSQINLAMERGESHGRWNTWTSWKSTRPEWIKEGKIVFLVQSALSKPADLQGPPLLIDLAKNEDDRRLFELVATSAQLGRPLVATPDVPADRMKALRAAYRATMQDPEFIKEAEQLKIEINPIFGEDLHKMVERTLATPKALTERFRKIIE